MPRNPVRPRILAASLALACASALALVLPVSAATVCVQGVGSVSVDIDAGDTATLHVGAGGEIEVDGAQCGTATVSDTDSISVHDISSGGAGTVVIDLSGGPFAPGLTSETSSSDEIEIAVDLSDGTDAVALEGGTGNDSIVAGADGLNLNAAELDGIDVDVTLAGVDALTFDGGSGDDVLSEAGGAGTGSTGAIPAIFKGGPGLDALSGGTGDDVITGGPDADSMDGGSGYDAADYSARTNPLTLTLDATANDGEAGESDNLVGIEELRGGAGGDSITGDGGANTLLGNGGDDTLAGGTGPDLLDGGAGNDVADYSARTLPLSISLDGAANDGESGETDNVTGFEEIRGGSGNDTITGGSGNERLFGNGGNDRLMGLAGADRFIGGTGADAMDGGSGFDTADYSDRSAPLTITLDGAANDGESGEGDNLTTLEEVLGGSGDDRITGDVGANSFLGGGGNDVLTGGSGDDTLRGGDGNDQLLAGGNDDFLEGGLGDDVENGSGSDDVFLQSPMTTFRSSGQPIPIPDKTGATMACVTVHMSIPAGTMRDTNIRIDVEHPAPADLNVYLDAPHSIYRNKPVTIVLTTDNDNGTQFEGTTFDSEATKKISVGLGARPLEGRFHAEGSFDQNLRGAESEGDWQLRVCDDGANGITGVLNWWEVDIVYPTAASDGSDTLIGGLGVHNLLDYAARTSPLNVTLDGLAGDGQTGESDNAGSDLNYTTKTGMDDLYAGMGNDNITGNDFANDMRGHGGNDSINGLGGNDRFRGGEGNDTIDAGAGDDPAINGNNGDDTLFGRNGNDRLDGGAGIDYLDGGGGTDTCLNAGGGEVKLNCE